MATAAEEEIATAAGCKSGGPADEGETAAALSGGSSSSNSGAVVDHLRALIRQEDDDGGAYPLCEDYLSFASAAGGGIDGGEVDRHRAGSSDAAASSAGGGNEDISEAWRRKLCEWSYEVVDHFNFDREVVSYATDYLDRTVASKTSASRTVLPKRDFQLLAVTSLYLAIKLHGESGGDGCPDGAAAAHPTGGGGGTAATPVAAAGAACGGGGGCCSYVGGQRRKLRIDAFVELSRGFFSIDLITETERSMLDALRWRVNPPTSLRYVSSFLQLCPRWTTAGGASSGRSLTSSQQQQLQGAGPHQQQCQGRQQEQQLQPPDSSSNSCSAVLRNVFDVARYLTELSLCISFFSFECKTFVTAYSSILCAIKSLRSPLPDVVLVAFLNNVGEATHGLLRPSSTDVVRACAMLKELCPAMFADVAGDFDDGTFHPSEINIPNSSPQSLEGNVSPVSVVDNTAASHGGINSQQHQHSELQEHREMEEDEEEGASPRSRRKRSHPSCLGSSPAVGDEDEVTDAMNRSHIEGDHQHSAAAASQTRA